MPSPDTWYLEIDAALASGYRLSEWRCEHPVVRGELIAHYLERQLREAFESEYWGKEADRKSGKGGRETQMNQFEAMKKMWGV